MSRAITRLFLPAFLLSLLIGAIGVVLLIIASTRLVGLVLVVFAIAVFFAAGPPAMLAGDAPAAGQPRLARSGLIVLTGVGLCLPLAVLAGIGILERHTAGYAFRYGDAVTVHVPDSCTEYYSRRAGEASGIDCPNATWVDRGQQVTGDLAVDEADLKTGNSSTYTVKDLPAWAYQHNAWTRRSGSGDFSVALGRLPDWMLFLFAPAALALVPLILLARRTNAARPYAR